MKPYKIIKSKNPLPKRYVLEPLLKSPGKIPYRFFRNVHPAAKTEIVVEYRG